MRSVHLMMPYSRQDLRDKLIEAYGPMGVVLHPLTFQGEKQMDSAEPWVQPFVAAKTERFNQSTLLNAFIRNAPIVDDDYYVSVSDDDMYESGVFDAIKKLDAPVVIISMKRGYHTPPNLPLEKQYPHNTLFADPDNIEIGSVGGEQIFMKGSVLKTVSFDETNPAIADGILAIRLKAAHPIHYEPDLFALFNYYEPGRWDVTGRGISFGVLVNDLLRLDMCLKQSEIPPSISCHFLKNPESACKGLNKLLAVMEQEGDEIGIFVHQDMFFRSGWIEQVKGQLEKLPDSWVVAGVIGKDMEGRVCGKFHDMRIPSVFNTSDIHTFPQAACCFDECVIIVNLKKSFRFDETLDGFDLYGTLCVLQAWEMGGTAWIIDAYCEHYCMRPFSWVPDERFCRNYKWLFDKFNKIYRLDSTALGLSKDHKIFKTSAAPLDQQQVCTV